MNIVAMNADTLKVFESQSYYNDTEKNSVIAAIEKDAISAGIEITLSEMTDEELKAAISVD